MKQLIHQINKFIERINEIFPEEGNLKGYDGIDKASLVESLKDTILILKSFPEPENEFAVASMVVVAQGYCENIEQVIKYSFSSINKSDIVKLLNNVIKLKNLLRVTYYELTEKPIQTATEIQQAKDELNTLLEKIDELKKAHIELLEKKEEFDEIIELIESKQAESETIVKDLTQKQIKIAETDARSTQQLTEIGEKVAEIDEASDNVEEWVADIKKQKEEYEKNIKEFSELLNRFRTAQKDIDKSHEQILGKVDEEDSSKNIKGYIQDVEDLKASITTFLTEQTKKYNAQFIEIEGLLPGATSAGLAEAYQIQRNSYKMTITAWSVVFVVTITIMGAFGLYLIFSQINLTVAPQTLSDVLISLLKDLPFFIPAIWLAGYASKQQSQYKRLQQEYAFKETNAKAFHGHKVQIEELMREGDGDQDLLLQLVSQLVYITSQNPSATLDNKTHEDNSPIFKFAENFVPSFFKKGKANEEIDG